MKYIYKTIIIFLILILFLPCVQSTNVFEDIENIDSGISDINDKLELIGLDISKLVESMDDMNNKLEDTNEGIEDMSKKLEELSNTTNNAILLAEKVDNYIEEIKTILWAGIFSIILAILIIIGATFIIFKKS